MTQTGKALADGYLPTTQGVLYTCPSGTRTYISEITLFNTHATPQTLSIYNNRSGTARREFYTTGFSQYRRAVRERGLVLEAGDTIEGETTTGSAVHYIISGVEET